MIYILDAGAVMNTSLLPDINGDIALPQSVRDEIKSQQALNLLATMAGNNRITVSDPLPQHITQVKETAIKIGQNRLSDQDIDVLALALMMSENGEITILSDDYGLRNVAHELELASRGITTTGGSERRTYGYICQACGHFYDFVVSECEICGHTRLKRTRKS